jgi:prevent-host-death family protein
MIVINLADAKARLSELVEKAANGESVCITRRGRPIARLTSIETPRKPIDLKSLQELTKGMSPQEESAGDFMRRMRDDERY